MELRRMLLTIRDFSAIPGSGVAFIPPERLNLSHHAHLIERRFLHGPKLARSYMLMRWNEVRQHRTDAGALELWARSTSRLCSLALRHFTIVSFDFLVER